MSASLVGIGTALPAHRVESPDAAAWMARALAAHPDAAHPDAAKFSRRVIERSGIGARFTCLAEYTSKDDVRVLGSLSPPTSVRMRAFREHAPPLAALACRRALTSARTEPEEITHLVVVTCTGFFAPGPDVELIALLGLRADVERTVVGFMGCCAAFNGLRVARQAVVATGGKALVVCVELCTLHFRPDGSAESVVAHALFGDGAAAVVVAADGADALVRLGPAASRVEPGTKADMGWEIGDEGFRMTLSSYVPQLLQAEIGAFVGPLTRGPVASWCVHPGGRAILDHVESALVLPGDALASSRAVLRDIGNVSSASVLFVLERELPRLAEGDAGVMLGFGPGLTLEGLAFTRGARRLATERVEAADAVRA